MALFTGGGGAGGGFDTVLITSADSPFTAPVPSSELTILADATGGDITINLPTIVAAAKKVFAIKRTDVTAGKLVTAVPAGGQTIDGAASYSLYFGSGGDSLAIQSPGSGTIWQILWEDPQHKTRADVLFGTANHKSRLKQNSDDSLSVLLTVTQPGPCVGGLAGIPGALSAGAYTYKIVFVTAGGSTEGGTTSNVVTVVVPAANGQIALVAIPVGPDGLVTARDIYRTAAGGAVHKYVATLGDNSTTTYLDNVADGALGAICPTFNTALDSRLAVKQTGEFVQGFAAAFPNLGLAANTTLTTKHFTVVVDTSGGGKTITLPSAAGAPGRFYVVKNKSTGQVTVAKTGGDTIDGAATFLLPAGAVAVFQSDGTSDWGILAKYGYDRMVTKAQIVANTNDYDLGIGDIFRLSSDASRNITGIVASGSGGQSRRVMLVNVGAQDIVLTNLDAASAAANQILTGTGGSVTLSPNQTAELWYDTTTANWRVI